MGVRLWLGFCAYGALSGAALVWRVGEAEAALRTSSPSPASKPAPTGLGARADVHLGVKASSTPRFSNLWQLPVLLDSDQRCCAEPSVSVSRGSQLLPDSVVEHGSDIIIHFMESQLCMLILLNFLCSLYGLLALTLKETFFGKLSPIESHKLTERAIKYASFKVVFVGAYVTPHILNITAWFAWFALLGIVKAFVGLCKDRLDTLMSAPSATRTSHIRNFGLLLFLFAGDFAGSLAVCSAFWGSAKSELMLVLFECILMAVEASQTLVRYCIFFAGMWRQLILGASVAAQQGLGTHATWEWQGAVLYHTDLLSELITLALSFCHYCHIWYLHGFSFQLVDAILFLNVRAVVCTLQRRFSAFIRYRAATHNLSVIFPDAKASEIACSEDDCAICKEQMTAAKRLPCGHLFHLHCLRAWLQQSGSDNFTCPICRAPLFLKPEELESSLSHRWGRAQDSTVDNLDRDESGQGNVRMLAHPPGGLVRALFGMNTRAEQGDTAEMRVQDLQLDAGHVLLFEFEQLRARHHGLSQRRLSYLTSTTTSSSVSLQSGTEGLENGNNPSISGREPQYPTDPASLMEMEPGSDDEVAKDNVVSSYLLDVSRSVSSARQSKGQAVSVGQSLRSRRNLRMEVEEGEEANSSSKIGQHGNN